MPGITASVGIGVCNLDTHMDGTTETKPSAPVKTPEWIPEQYRGSYLGYLQQYTAQYQSDALAS